MGKVLRPEHRCFDTQRGLCLKAMGIVGEMLWLSRLAHISIVMGLLALPAFLPSFVAAEALAQASSGDDAAYRKVVADPTIAGMRKYLREFPFGTHRDDVKAMLDRQSEALAWQRAKTSNSRAGLSAYLELYPDGEHAAEAKRLMAAQNSGSALHGYPDTVLNGTVSAQVTADMDTCRSTCTERQGCAGFDHTASGNVCRLFSSVGSARGVPGSSAATREAIAGYNSAPADMPPPPAQEPHQSKPQIADVQSAPETECDRLAAMVEDPEKLSSVKGVAYQDMDGPAALAACAAAYQRYPDVQRIQYQYGRALDHEKKYVEAMQYYMKAADRGNLAATNNIGRLYSLGRGVNRDHAKALAWYKKASEKGFLMSTHSIGSMYNVSYGPFGDYDKALFWYKKAAKRNYIASMRRIGQIYENGYGRDPDYDQAFKWYKKAADLRSAGAMFDLGNLYYWDDNEKAAIWYERSIRYGFQFLRDLLRNRPDTSYTSGLRRSLQRVLQREGVYDGPLDGSFGPKTQAALDAIFATEERQVYGEYQRYWLH